MAYTFGAQDILSVLGITAADWEIQDNNANRKQDWANTKSKLGAVVDASETAHNDRTEYTLNLKVADGVSDTPVTFKMGGVGTTGVVITGFAAKQAFNDLATLAITAHKHETIEEGAAHLAAPAEVAVALTLGFGVTEVFLNGTEKDCQSSDLSGAMEHVDKFSNTGKFLVGASSGFRLECTEEYVDSGDAISPDAPWHKDGEDKRTTNGDVYTRSIRAHANSFPA